MKQLLTTSPDRWAHDCLDDVRALSAEREHELAHYLRRDLARERKAGRKRQRRYFGRHKT